MDWPILLGITGLLVAVLIASGVRIAWALFGLGFLILYVAMPANQDIMMGFSAWASTKSFVLCAVPLFILLSQIIFRCGLSDRIFNSISPVLDHVPGGLLHTNIATGAILAATTGSITATTATIATVSLPETEKRGYDTAIVMGSICAGGCLGPLIPPSITMVVYGAMTEVSVGQLFIAGILPGIMMTLLFMIYIGVRVSLQPHLAPRWASGYVPLLRSLLGLVNIWPAILLALVVLGSIYAGVATPTEAAGMGCVFALIIAAGYRQLNWEVLKISAIETVKITCMVLFIFMGAKLMVVPLINMGIFAAFIDFVVTAPVPPLGILLGIILIYLILGCFMSGLPAIIVTLPITFPAVVALGYDPVWFGVIMVLLNEVGSVSPPVGALLFIMQGFRPQVPFLTIVRGVMPFLLVILVGGVILTVFPQIATWLPGLMWK